MKRILTVLACVLFLAAASSGARAGSVDVPNVFTPDTPARADSVNENFSAVELAVDDNAAMITSLQSAHTGTRTGYLSIGAGAFTPFDANYGNFYRFSGISIRPNDAASTKFIAGASLPHNAQVVSFRAKFLDSDAGGAGIADLREYCAGTEASMASVTSVDNVTTQWYADYTVSSPDVDSTDCSYSILVNLQTVNIWFHKAIIEYQYTLD